MRPFKKSIVLTKKATLEGEYAIMSKCDGVFVSLAVRGGKLVVRDVDRNFLFSTKTSCNFSFFVYADMIHRDRFFAYDNSLDTDFRTRHQEMTRALSSERRVTVVEAIFTFSPLDNLLNAPKIDAPCDGVVLVSVFDATAHFKWKPVQTADFVITETGQCLVGWRVSDENPYPWFKFSSKGASYFGVPFGDENGPHKFLGDVAKVSGKVVECRFQSPDRWIPVRKRDDKTLQYISSPVFCGANSWTTVQSVFELSR